MRAIVVHSMLHSFCICFYLQSDCHECVLCGRLLLVISSHFVVQYMMIASLAVQWNLFVDEYFGLVLFKDETPHCTQFLDPCGIACGLPIRAVLPKIQLVGGTINKSISCPSSRGFRFQAQKYIKFTFLFILMCYPIFTLLVACSAQDPWASRSWFLSVIGCAMMQ